MKRWVIAGCAVMAAAWIPFLYAELSSEPAEKKAREVFTEAKEQAVLPAAGSGTESEKGPPAPPPEAIPLHATPEPEPEKPPPPPAATVPAAPADAGGAVTARMDSADTAEHAPPPPPPSASGPIDVLKHAYETQPRDALWARDAESLIHGLFGSKELPADMLRGASCRRAVCRVQLNWTPEHAPALPTLNQRIAQEFGPEVAIAPIAASDGQEVREVDLYFTRKGFTVADLSK